MLQPMFANAIKEDSIISTLKKVSKTTTKPRAVSFQEGGDDVTTKTKSIVWRQNRKGGAKFQDSTKEENRYVYCKSKEGYVRVLVLV